jgi:intraflagellar transport protein 172
MYTAAGDTENVVRLTAQFGGDSAKLAATAAQAEREGNLSSAESCYVRAGQWEKALFMYRQEKRWQDAMRVAKQHGNPTHELQVAVHWAKEIGGAAGIQKLQQLGRTEEALLYCCENGITDLATLIMSTAKGLPRATIQQAHVKFGQALEAQRQFAEAEAHYVAADMHREAVEMYSHNKMWADAQRVAAKFGVTDVATGPGKSSTKAEGLSGVKKAMRLEEQRQYEDAITAYLALTATDCGSEERLDQVLERAVKLAANFVPAKLREVVTAVAQVLIGMNRHASLGKILENIEAYADAFEIYKLAEMWDDANRLCAYLDPEDQAAFQREYQEHLASRSDTNGLITLGQVDAALQVFAKKGEWDSCLKQARKEGEQYLEKYTMLYAQDLVNKKKYDEAVGVLARYSPSANSANLPAYIGLCQATVYAVPTYDVIQESFFALRQMLFKVLKGAQPSAKDYGKLRNFTRAVHLLCQQAICTRSGLPDLALRASIAVLRYSNLVPADFLFYHAGELCKLARKPEAALVYWNRFVDIHGAVSGGDLSGANIDHERFEGTDIPKELCLRKQLAVSESLATKANDWVLEETVGGEVDAQLPMTSCRKCGRQIYAANLECPFCKQVFEFCHVTGYPIANGTKCTACGVTANRTDWGQFIAKTGRCPCCDAPQTAGA